MSEHHNKTFIYCKRCDGMQEQSERQEKDKVILYICKRCGWVCGATCDGTETSQHLKYVSGGKDEKSP